MAGRRDNIEILLSEAVSRKEATLIGALQSVLIYVVRSGDAAFVASVLEKGLDVNTRGAGGVTMLHDCVAASRMAH